MNHVLPPLPYPLDGLVPFISQTTLDFHYYKHHQAYVDNLNKFIFNTEFENLSIEEIIRTAPAGAIFNNAAQARNHTFYWQCMGPSKTNNHEPTGKLREKIEQTFGSFDSFKEEFSKHALSNFGSGWTWLVLTHDGKLEIVNTSNAGCPVRENKKPLLTIDVWEHAYYLDYQNRRGEYINNWWNLVAWQKIETHL